MRYRLAQDNPLWNQSDRMYPPFIPAPTTSIRWMDLSTGIEGRAAIERQPAHGQFPPQLDAPEATYSGRDTTLAMLPTAAGGSSQRRLNPWLVLFDWRAHASDVRVVARCIYRDYPRIVLERDRDRLYLNEWDAVPIKLDRTEPDTYWGQLHVEYLWTTWWTVRGGGLFPIASFRQFDGVTNGSTRVLQNAMDLIPADSAPRLEIKDAPVVQIQTPVAQTPGPTDTVRVNDHTFLLVTRFYTETVTLQRDTVFLLDATTSEARAREDSAWIARLFPGKHKTVVVVTDLAWPHIGGVRFWVARGAMFVARRGSEDFLHRLVDRKWTLNPDVLEKSRATSPFHLRLVDDSLRLAGGSLVAHAMRGETTEGALAVWLPADRYLWAGDYVQPDPTSPYVADVVRTVRSLSLQPDKVGGEHVKLTDWADVDRRVPR